MSDQKINISISVLADEAIKRLENLKKTTDSLSKTNDMESMFKKADKALDNLKKTTESYVNTVQSQNTLTNKAASSFNQFAITLAALQVDKVIGGIISLGNSLYTNVISGSIDAAAALDKVKQQFFNITGSLHQTEIALEAVEKFKKISPFDSHIIEQAATSLLKYNVNANDIESTLESLGNIGAKTGVDIAQLAQQFGEISARGLVTTRDLRNLETQGIPIIQALIEATGKSVVELARAADKNEISTQQFQKAFETLSQKGGFAFGALERAQNSYEGRLNKLNVTINNFQEDLGKAFLPALSAGTSAITKMIDSFKDSGKLDEFVKFISDSIPSAITIFANSISFLISLFSPLISGFSIVKGVAVSLAGDFYSLTASLKELESFILSKLGFAEKAKEMGALAIQTREVANGFYNSGEASFEFAKQVDDVATKTKQFIDDTKNNFNSLYKEQIDGNKATVISDIDSSNSQKINLAQLEQAKDLAHEAQKKRDAERAKQLELEKQQQAEKIKAADDLNAKLFESFAKIGEAELANQEATLTADQIFHDERLLSLSAFFESKQAAELQEAIDSADNETLRQIAINKAVETGLKNKTAIETADAAAREKLEKTKNTAILKSTGDLFGSLANLAALGGKDFFEASKAFAIADATIKGYQAVQLALATGGPFPANLIAATATGIQTAATIAKIASQQAPAFETGGIVPGSSFSGDNIMARVNSGEMILNQQQQAKLFQMANGGNGNQEMTINTSVVLDGEIVARSVSRQVANGLKLGEAS